MALWPLKDDQMADEEAKVTVVYQYGDLLEKKDIVEPKWSDIYVLIDYILKLRINIYELNK